MSLRLTSFAIFILLTVSCNTSTNNIITENFAEVYNERDIEFTKLNESISFTKYINNERHLFISYILNNTSNQEYKELRVDLKHQYEKDSYLDFGYFAKLNDFRLNRYHRQKNYNIFDYRKKEKDLLKRWSLELDHSFIHFNAPEGKMLIPEDYLVSNPKLIRITNLNHNDQITFATNFRIELNRNSSVNNFYVGIELFSDSILVEQFLFRQKKASNTIAFKEKDIVIIQQSILSKAATIANIWLLDEIELEPIKSYHKYNRNYYLTPTIFKSVYGILIRLSDN